MEMICEVAIAKIELGKSSLYLVGVYKTKGNLEAGLDVVSDALECLLTNKPVVIIGDINIDSKAKKNDYILMTEILTSYNIQRLDLPYTRITPTSRTSIDCVCTNLQLEKLHVKVLDTAISNHTGQLCTINLDNYLPPSPLAERKNMSTRNLLKSKALLHQQNWTAVYSSTNAEESYNSFSAQLKKEYDLRLKYLRRQEDIDVITVADNKSKAIWQIINSERKSKEDKPLPLALDIQGELISDP
ncbi:hypothetical protein J6590_045868, partial [Homalodisca vitripennis]